MPPTRVRYREYAPCEALRGSVRALFSFSTPDEMTTIRPVLLDVRFDRGERLCAPGFADAHSCIAFSFENHYCPDGVWRSDSVRARAEVIGPVMFPGPPSVPMRAETVGAYLRAGTVIPGFAAAEMENRVIALEDGWGAAGRELLEQLSAAPDQAARLDRLESALIERVARSRPRRTSLDVPAMAAWIARNAGQLPVERLAETAGLSRRHLTRLFRENIGVSPKVYCELARFRSALAHVRRAKNGGWAQVAVQCGYTDQSHMIAEFRRFSGFTPDILAQGQWFHPFIEGAQQNRNG